MAKSDTVRANPGHLPMAIGPTQRRPLDHSARPDAAFLAQLMAARDNLATQRLRRRASESDATRAYRDTAASAVRRMPAGYRSSSDA